MKIVTREVGARGARPPDTGRCPARTRESQRDGWPLAESRRTRIAQTGLNPVQPPRARPGVRISCIVCTYNEAGRIREVLDAVRRHRALAEVIVVDDGSTDGTEAVLQECPDILVVSYAPNRGKTYALSRGIDAATGDYVMTLDADLAGVTAADIQALADPVLRGEADVSISLRRNSLWPYRRIGLDFVSGERVIPASLVRGATQTMARLPRWGAEPFVNNLIIRAGLTVAVVDWPTVFNVRKYRKLGWWRGVLAEIAMVADQLRILSPWGVLHQNLALLRLMAREHKPPPNSSDALELPRTTPYPS